MARHLGRLPVPVAQRQHPQAVQAGHHPDIARAQFLLVAGELVGAQRRLARVDRQRGRVAHQGVAAGDQQQDPHHHRGGVPGQARQAQRRAGLHRGFFSFV
ncbi:hypothetical protein KBW71_26520, partial [Hydrogenophaga aromaticivorans]|uniref:hypothetical protein n=1 Tax=Hydrogenophaga aromaticivorans TaxID=2610898 RepID=UPI001B38452E